VVALGSLLMALVLPPLLGMPVASVAALAGFAVLAALAFTAVVQALVATGGRTGWLVALLLLVVGIAASGVPFGAAAAPGPLAVLHALLPLGHAIDGFRAAITGGGLVLVHAVVLVAWLVGAALVTLAYAAGVRRGTTGPDGVVVPA
jgi:putative membrane protein